MKRSFTLIEIVIFIVVFSVGVLVSQASKVRATTFLSVGKKVITSACKIEFKNNNIIINIFISNSNVILYFLASFAISTRGLFPLFCFLNIFTIYVASS